MTKRNNKQKYRADNADEHRSLSGNARRLEVEAQLAQAERELAIQQLEQRTACIAAQSRASHKKVIWGIGGFLLGSFMMGDD